MLPTSETPDPLRGEDIVQSFQEWKSIKDYRPINAWNQGKKEEYSQRVEYSLTA
jgi:hypothetical protein